MIHRGMSLREALAEAERLGVPHEHVNRTGELKFRRLDGRFIMVNGRKRDACSALVSLLRQAERARVMGGS